MIEVDFLPSQKIKKRLWDMKLLSALVSLRFTLVYVISELYFHTNIDRNNAIMSESSKRKIFSLSTVPLVLITSALLTEFKPQPIQKNIITKSFDIKPLQKGTPFTLFNWNIQYAGSRRHHFFMMVEMLFVFLRMMYEKVSYPLKKKYPK